MSKATDGAKGCKGMSVKPDANNPKADCPCDEFLHCSTRIPYGANMWSNGNRRKKAISKISYQINSGRFDLIKRIGKSIDKKASSKSNGSKPKAMALRNMDEHYVETRMVKLKVGNAAGFTNFQRQMVIRANLVQNEFVLRSDGYDEGIDKFEYVIPYPGEIVENMWNVDHIKPRSKGACNRFCNAQLLSRKANIKKGASGKGCPCAEERDQPASGQKAFDVSGSIGGTLWQCYTVSNDREKPPNKIPTFPPGMIKKYPEGCNICGVDNPCEWSKALQETSETRLRKEIEKISG